MLQGNVCYRLLASQNYRPGATGATAGPQTKELPISGVFVAAGAATLDFFDANNNRNIITSYCKYIMGNMYNNKKFTSNSNSIIFFTR
jgi:hypothetical protein